MSELLGALQESWGLAGRVNSIRALLELLERWCEDVDNEVLQERLSLSIEHFVTEELDSAQFSTEGLPPEASDCISELTTQFESMSGCLERLDEALQERDLPQVTELSSQIRETAQEIGEVHAALDEWMSNPEPCCLACGGTEESEGWCPECGIELLIPNLKSSFDNVNVQLDPEFFAIYECYLAIGRGEVSLSSILELLPPAEAHVAQLEQAAKSVNRKASDAEARKGLQSASKEVYAALNLIREATDSFRKADLDLAWQATAKALVNKNKALGEMIQRLGIAGDDQGDQISLQ